MDVRQFIRKIGLKYADIRHLVKNKAIHAAIVFARYKHYTEFGNLYFVPPIKGGEITWGMWEDSRIFWFDSGTEGVVLYQDRSIGFDYWTLGPIVRNNYPCDFIELSLPDPAWKRVDESQFFVVLSSLFKISPPVLSVGDFLGEFEGRRYDKTFPFARFFIFPTYYNTWGYVYQTSSGKQLIYKRGCLYTRGMRIDANVPSIIASILGNPCKLPEPKWLNHALLFKLEFPRENKNYVQDIMDIKNSIMRQQATVLNYLQNLERGWVKPIIPGGQL